MEYTEAKIEYVDEEVADVKINAMIIREEKVGDVKN
jgi:hypothetical protein